MPDQEERRLKVDLDAIKVAVQKRESSSVPCWKSSNPMIWARFSSGCPVFTVLISSGCWIRGTSPCCWKN